MKPFWLVLKTISDFDIKEVATETFGIGSFHKFSL